MFQSQFVHIGMKIPMVEEKSLHEENDWLTNYISLNDDTEEQEWGAQNETPQKKMKPDFVSILENNISFSEGQFQITFVYSVYC